MLKRIFIGILVLIILHNMFGRGSCIHPLCFLNLREGLNSNSSSNTSDMIVKNSADVSTLQANLKKGKDRLTKLSKRINDNITQINKNNTTIKSTVSKANAAQAAHNDTTSS